MTALSNQVLNLVAKRFKVLADPIRLQILNLLGSEERNVNEIAHASGSSQPNVSKHLRLMQDAGIVKRRQEKTSVYYSVCDSSVFLMCEMIKNTAKKNTKAVER